MKHTIFLAAVLLLTATAVGQDWEGDLLGMEAGALHGSVGISWESEYIWRGFDIYDDKSVTHLLADLNLFETGFGVSAVGHRANSSGFENGERWDYTAYYQNGIFSGEPYATNYRFGWVYYDYPDTPSQFADLQEGHVILSWPNLLPVKGLCPSYVVAKMWPSQSESGIGSRARGSGTASGWIHILMLDYGFTVPGIIPEVPEHLIKLHSELVYNDGWSYNGRNVDQEWSHAVFGASTDIDLGHNISLTPAVYYQVTMERSVNTDDDELWAGLSMKYSF